MAAQSGSCITTPRSEQSRSESYETSSSLDHSSCITDADFSSETEEDGLESTNHSDCRLLNLVTNETFIVEDSTVCAATIRCHFSGLCGQSAADSHSSTSVCECLTHSLSNDFVATSRENESKLSTAESPCTRIRPALTRDGPHRAQGLQKDILVSVNGIARVANEEQEQRPVFSSRETGSISTRKGFWNSFNGSSPSNAADDLVIQAQAKAFREEIHKIVRNPDPAIRDIQSKLDDRKSYINTYDLSRILTREVFRAFFKLVTRRFNEAELEELYYKFPHTFGTLLLVEETNWNGFWPFFYSGRRDYSRGDQSLPRKADVLLPFFSEDHDVAADFCKKQRLFNPAVFPLFGKVQDLSVPLLGRLPFRYQSKISRDGGSKVYDVILDHYARVVSDEEPGRKDMNPTPEPYAMKRFTTLAECERELANHKKIRDAAGEMLCHFVLNVFAFAHKEYYYILLPLAQMTLEDLFSKRTSSYGKDAFPPTSVLYQLRSIFRDTKFLHDNVGLTHGDIKSANILIYPSTESTCGEWRLADFGLSRLEEPDLEIMLGISEETFNITQRSSSSVEDARLYQPPSGGIFSHKDDYFSLGAVAINAANFIFGGPELVAESIDHRNQDGHDLYYCKASADQRAASIQPLEFIMKPHVLEWNRTRLSNAENAPVWLAKLVDLSQTLMDLDPLSRTTVSDACRILDEIITAAEGHPQIWTGTFKEDTDMVIERKTRAEIRTMQKCLIGSQMRFQPHDILVLRPLLAERQVVPARISQHWLCVTTLQTIYLYGFSCLATYLQPSVDKSFSRESQQQVSSLRAEPTTIKLDCGQFENTLIAGHYVAVIYAITRRDEEDSYVDVYDLHRMQIIYTIRIPTTSKSKVILSSHGYLAWIHPDGIHISNEQGQYIPLALGLKTTIMTAAFSHHGESLCVVSSTGEGEVAELLLRVFTFGEQYDAQCQPLLPRVFEYVPIGNVRSCTSDSLMLSSTLRGEGFFVFFGGVKVYYIDCLRKSGRVKALTTDFRYAKIRGLIPVSWNSILVVQNKETPLIKFSTEGNCRDGSITFLEWGSWDSTINGEFEDMQLVSLNDSEATMFAVHERGLLSMVSLAKNQISRAPQRNCLSAILQISRPSKTTICTTKKRNWKSLLAAKI